MNINNVAFERSFGVSSQLTPSTMPEIAFAGRSNVGKSSLLNKLFNRKGLAKVSQTPGKTATINFFSCDGVRFVDLPGYGYAKVSKSEKERWSELIEGYFNQERDLALVVSLVDIRHDASDLDVNMIGFLQEAELPFAVVLTKADKLSRQQQLKQKAALKKQLKLGADVPLVVTLGRKGRPASTSCARSSRSSVAEVTQTLLPPAPAERGGPWAAFRLSRCGLGATGERTPCRSAPGR